MLLILKSFWNIDAVTISTLLGFFREQRVDRSREVLTDLVARVSAE